MGLALAGVADASARAGIDMAYFSQKSCYVEKNRNLLVQISLEQKADYSLWLDTDNVFPSDTLIRLLKHDKEIVGANYRARSGDHEYLGRFADGNDEWVVREGLHEMLTLPGGVTLVRNNVYRSLPWPWYEATLSAERDEVYFCMIAREAGWKIWCDMDLTYQVRHIGEIQVPWYGVPWSAA